MSQNENTELWEKSQPIVRIPKVAKRVERQNLFARITSNGTIAAAVMVAAAICAVITANSPLYHSLHTFFETPLAIQVGTFTFSMTFEQFVNDFLMALFFLLVGIELKYEMTVGQLRKPRQAMLPMLAAVGGVCVPSLIYLVCNWGGAVHGWAVPMATDIAFALGAMSLLGSRVAPATKVFFSTLAIADDVLAIVVIALFYGQTPQISWLLASVICILVLTLLNKSHVYNVKPYMLVGLVLWFCVYNSGIHATLAGVILAFALPARSDIRLNTLRDWVGERARKLDAIYDENAHILGQHDFTEVAEGVEKVMHHVRPPLQRVESSISVLVNFFILPLFAFVNAQVCLVGVDMTTLLADPVVHGVFFGALLGKPIGIILTTLILVKLKFAKLPRGVDMTQIVGVGIMGGLGFTMSILIADLAFVEPAEVLAAKCAILVGSVVVSILGAAFIFASSAYKKKKQQQA